VDLAGTLDQVEKWELIEGVEFFKGHEIGGEELLNPLAGNGGHFTKRERCVVSFSLCANEGKSHMAFPDGRHAFTCMATPALAKGILREYSAVDLLEVSFVNPGLADCHYVTTVVEHEAVAVGVTKEIESNDIPLEVDRGNRLIASIDPNKLSSSFDSLFFDP
jgi:hypothetical protein